MQSMARASALTLMLLVFSAFLAACGDDGGVADGSLDGDTARDSAIDAPVDAASDASDDAAVPDTGTDGGRETIAEAEPNDGTTTTEFNDAPVGAIITGAVGTPGDSDLFRFDATPGEVYRITVTPAVGSVLEPHLTVIDAGRGGEAAGGDYVKIDLAGATAAASLEVLAMGTGGYFAAVRDRRNVGAAATEGSAAHTYSLRVERVTDHAVAPLTFPSSPMGALEGSGAIELYSFEGTVGSDVFVDFRATGTTGLDGRLFIYAAATGDWIARNDNRSAGDPDPLLDAPLTASGSMMLVVENIEPEATGLDYQLTASMP